MIKLLLIKLLRKLKPAQKPVSSKEAAIGMLNKGNALRNSLTRPVRPSPPLMVKNGKVNHGYWGKRYYPGSFNYALFEYFTKNYNLTLVDSEIAEIVYEVTSSKATSFFIEFFYNEHHISLSFAEAGIMLNDINEIIEEMKKKQTAI